MHTTREPSKQRQACRRRERVLPVAAAVLAVGLLVAGCGASPSTPSPNNPNGGSQAGSQAIAYSRCMRSHGVPSFPDPTISRSGGHVGIGLGIPASASASPAFKTAQQAARSSRRGARRAMLPRPSRRSSTRKSCNSRRACAPTAYRTSPIPTPREPSTWSTSKRTLRRSQPRPRSARSTGCRSVSAASRVPVHSDQNPSRHPRCRRRPYRRGV
jgi:hypothetical protein